MARAEDRQAPQPRRVPLFAYGTLMRGEALSPAMRIYGALFLREAATAAKYSLMDMGVFPALLETGEWSIIGELYLISEEALDELDFHEGAPDLFERKTVELETGEEAVAYVLPTPLLKGADEKLIMNQLILSGSWAERQKTDV